MPLNGTKMAPLLLLILLCSLSASSAFNGSSILAANMTILSKNKTFEMGFFSNGETEQKWYLGIWYASIPAPTYVWVANRENPIRNLSSVSLEITEKGNLAVRDGVSGTIFWETNNVERGRKVELLEQGNLVVYSGDGQRVWQSFDFPTDTWLPGMNLTADQWLTCWKSSNDPSPGKYSLRLTPPDYGEISLVYDVNNVSYVYWSTGNWTGNAFSGVPEMTVPYIYSFYFDKAFTSMASFGYNEVALDSGSGPPLTRFYLDYTGQLKQFTWSLQTDYWNMFWSQPENLCRVYALCGGFGFCNARLLSPCRCLSSFRPGDEVSWDAGDFSGGCRRDGDDVCGKDDGFEEAGVVSYEGATMLSFSGTRSVCEKTCLGNCSCIGLVYSGRSSLCKNLYGTLLNLRNLSESTSEDELFLRVPGMRNSKEKNRKVIVLIEAISGCLAIIFVGFPVVLFLRRWQIRKRKEEEEGVFPVTNLKMFSYKELHSATKGFSEKLGHGGFGAVFQGEISDDSNSCSTLVAVKRLEKPGGGEKEFRAEVCTIGNIQHVNLVRLRGFCSEDSHRLLVYDYMPNGPLSSYLKRDGKNLSWDVRFRIAIGTAKGIAYLHEECRNCIIHCDIKPENILLDEDFSSKVSDFGLAKLVGRDFSRVLATMRGTWGYVAPEWISGVAITSKADVYSYGMTLLELLGGRRNVEGPPPSAGGNGNGTEKWFFPPWAAGQIIEGNVAAVVDQRLGNIYNQEEAKRAGLVAIWCIQDDESVRPSMGMVVKMLEGMVELTIPPPPKLLQALVSGESFQGIADHSSSTKASNYGDQSSGDNVQLSLDSKASMRD